ncbi:MAG: hypothetical protein ACFFDJ_05350 [Candidatus Odinarchaeota archaeon]
MLSQPRSVLILIFLGVILLLTGFTLLLMPWILGVVPAYFILAIGIITLILAGCLTRK